MPVLNPLLELRRRFTVPRWEFGSVVAIAGSGVSIQASTLPPEPGDRKPKLQKAASWPGLLELGIEHCERLPKKPPGWSATALRQDLAKTQLKELLAVAQQVESALRRAGALREFLEESVGRLEPTEPRILQALARLGVPMATTNYDGLIEWVQGLQPLTWRHAAAVDEWFTGLQPGVLHLHGHFRETESVVLGRTSYEEVLADGHAQNVLRMLWQQRTLLFVGVGDGLEDPNFGALLDWALESKLSTDCFHVLLVRNDVHGRISARLPVTTGIRVIPYGADYADLAPFLQSLADSQSGPERHSAVVSAEIVAGGGPVERRSLRRQLGDVLPAAAAFEAFCLDFFPQVFHQFTRGMERTQQETLLLALPDDDLAQLPGLLEQVRADRRGPSPRGRLGLLGVLGPLPFLLKLLVPVLLVAWVWGTGMSSWQDRLALEQSVSNRQSPAPAPQAVPPTVTSVPRPAPPTVLGQPPTPKSAPEDLNASDSAGVSEKSQPSRTHPGGPIRDGPSTSARSNPRVRTGFVLVKSRIAQEIVLEGRSNQISKKGRSGYPEGQDKSSGQDPQIVFEVPEGEYQIRCGTNGNHSPTIVRVNHDKKNTHHCRDYLP